MWKFLKLTTRKYSLMLSLKLSRSDFELTTSKVEFATTSLKQTKHSMFSWSCLKSSIWLRESNVIVPTKINVASDMNEKHFLDIPKYYLII